MDWYGRTLVIDNYDSFTWNLVHALEKLGDDPVVIRPADFSLQGLQDAPPRRLLISPGPGSPTTSPVSGQALRAAIGTMPVLGVCLGHQHLGAHFEIPLVRLSNPVHGKTALIDHDGTGLFDGVPNPVRCMRYHSLALQCGRATGELRENAWYHGDVEPVVMGLQHRELPVAGVQFHPESFLTEHGERILENFLSWV